MASSIYLTLRGEKQGLISSGCSSQDSIGNLCRPGHADQIYVYELNHSITREQHVSHHPIVITKPVDKSSPLLAVALSDNERLNGEIEAYRTNSNGSQELFYNIKLTDIFITEINLSSQIH